MNVKDELLKKFEEYVKQQAAKKDIVLMDIPTGYITIRSDKYRKALQELYEDADKIYKITVPNRWYNKDFKNVFTIYKIDFFYITEIEEFYLGLGDEFAEKLASSDKERLVVYEDVNWIKVKKTLHHWEDGTFKYVFYPKVLNTAKYLIGLKPEEIDKKPYEIFRWKNNEYTDFGFNLPEDTWMFEE